MKVYSIYILNKAGGLIYQNDVNPGLTKLTANDYLVLAGTLHGVHAIASKLSINIDGMESHQESTANANSALLVSGRSQDANNNKSGLQSIETDLFNLYVFQTLTGIKFIIITSPNPGELKKSYDSANEVFKQLYIVYSDYVMKDPFYSLDMPIKSFLFDTKVKEFVT
ncbi:Golgi vesicle docking [Scheffersomyces stipitis CBS 6054]|uniref:Trafficking protein particle complex subunit n=1 Tax=Scheffersomyces stipitis (strain ATCC 58785 / CBS 6054 / NBRC 10063 / NRRL Y-11545) TaxID=322104 RepID=A3LR64_PICST|nr:Golgi vesicle docking [Scheffersomyces stipitis CBS 6054]ABN65329.2 Golgi vesicle docking [Scheffersomyces stipitis CBS 6054]